MDKDQAFEKWWADNHLTSPEWLTKAAWNHQQAKIDKLMEALKQSIAYMETDKPGNTFRLMCLNCAKEALSSVEK